MVNINLLPKRLRRRIGPDWWRTAAIAIPLILFGIIAYITLRTENELITKTHQRDQIQAEVQILRPYIAEYQKLESQKKELDQIASIAREVRATFKPWSEYLAKFLNKLPTENGQLVVSLSSVNARTIDLNQAEQYYGIPAQVEFDLRGEAASEKALVEFVKAFETDADFGINFQNASFDRQTGIYSFSAGIGMVVEAAQTPVMEGARETTQ